jgi:hypothetical protein
MINYIELGLNDLGEMIYGRVDEDGLIRLTCIESNADYQAYLAYVANGDRLPSNSAIKESPAKK